MARTNSAADTGLMWDVPIWDIPRGAPRPRSCSIPVSKCLSQSPTTPTKRLVCAANQFSLNCPSLLPSSPTEGWVSRLRQNSDRIRHGTTRCCDVLSTAQGFKTQVKCYACNIIPISAFLCHAPYPSPARRPRSDQHRSIPTTTLSLKHQESLFTWPRASLGSPWRSPIHPGLRSQ